MKLNSGRLWLRIIVYGLSAIILAAIVTQSLIYWKFDEPAVRHALADSLQDTHRQVLVDGTITPRVFPFPGVDITRLTITEPNSALPFTRIARMEVRLAWWPLLFGHPQIQSLTLYDPEISVERLDNGSYSISDLFKRPQRAGFKFALNTLKVRDGVISYHDQLSGSNQRLDNINFDADSIADEAIISGSALLMSNNQQPVHIAVHTPMIIGQQNTRLPSLDAVVQTSTPQWGNVKVHASGAYNFDWTTFTTTGENLSFDISADQPQSSAKLTVPGMIAELDHIIVPQSHVSAKMQDGRSHYQLETNLSNLDITQTTLKSSRVNGEFNWQVGDNQVKLAIDAPLLYTDQGKLQLAPLSINARALTPLLPRGQLIVDLKGSLNGDITQQLFTLNSQGTIDGSNIALAVTQHGLVKPRHDVTLKLGSLDLNRYLPEAKGEAVAIFQDNTPIPLDWMDLYNLNAKISAGELSVGRFKMKDVSADVEINPDLLDVTQISANIYNGQLSGDASLKRGQIPRFSFHQTLNGMNIKPLMLDLFNFGQLEGKGSGQISVTAQGQSFFDLRKSLSGTAKMSLNQGALTGIDLVAALKNLPAELKEMNTPARTNQKTTFSTLSASFNMDQGIGRNQDLTLASQLVNVQGGGKLDFRHGIIDYNMNVEANPQEFSSLKGVNIPLKITGPLNAPIYALNFNALVRGTKTEKEKQQIIKQELKKQITTMLP